MTALRFFFQDNFSTMGVRLTLLTILTLLTFGTTLSTQTSKTEVDISELMQVQLTTSTSALT